MSAICGILRFDGGDVEPGTVARMARRMPHRGPDGIDTVELGRLALGHCLMHVNREDLYEAQPIVERDAVLAADCRIDNREALAAQLGIADAALATMPDSVVLLYAWRRWGDDVATHLLGDFTFAIFDRAAGTLLIGRDHMGQRPLFYHVGESFVALATEVNALFDADVPRRINEDELARRLLWSTAFVPGETIYRDVAILPGGSTLRLDATGEARLVRYWEPHAGAEHMERDDAHFIAAYQATVEEAVACRVRRLIAPPALALSGGFDSGIIATVAGPVAAQNGNKLIAAASVLAEDAADRDARTAVETFRAYPWLDIQYYVRGGETNYDDLESSFAATGSPGAPSKPRDGLHAIARRGGARLIMDGHGGDYTVNAYDTQWLGRIIASGNWRRFASEFRARMRFTGKRALSLIRADILPALTPLRISAWGNTIREGFAPAWRRRGLNTDFAAQALRTGNVDRRRLIDGAMLHSRGRARSLDIARNMAAGVPGFHIAAAQAGLDLTRPFHDKRIVELGLAIPDSLHFREGRDRWLARTVFADRLPRRMIERQLPNDREQPDLFRMMREAAPHLLAETRALDRDDAISRYVDLDAVEDLLEKGDRESVKADRVRTGAAIRALTIARFVAWVDRSNL